MKILLIVCLICFTNVSGQNVLYNYTQYINQNIEKLGFIDINANAVAYYLWTRELTSPFKIESGKLGNVLEIKKDKVFKIITHGYMNNASANWMVKMKNEYLKKADYNVILVDWGKAANVLYPLSAKYTKCIGKYLGQFVYDLNKSLGVPFENIHLIGHSLGAHVSGFAGKYVRTFNTNVSRITGLDPAGPLFLLASDNNHINKNDATFVDIIHTDGLKYGYIKPCGDIDFYPNAGTAPQPGCDLFNLTQEILEGCSHTRSHTLFIESISSTQFVSSFCSNYAFYTMRLCTFGSTAIMGENVNNKSTGIYQLTTNAVSPYARNGAI